MGRKKKDKESEPLLNEDDNSLLNGESENEKNDQPDTDAEDHYDSNGNLMSNGMEHGGDDKRDKIFNNAYNNGDTDFKELPDIKADGEYADRNLGHVYNAEEYNMQLKLSKMCSDTFDKSQWSGLPRDKKFPKELMPYIFNDLFKALDHSGHSVIDIFIAIAEFMDTSYEKVYWAAGVKVKERLIAECNQKYGSLDKRDLNRLF